ILSITFLLYLYSHCTSFHTCCFLYIYSCSLKTGSNLLLTAGCSTVLQLKNTATTAKQPIFLIAIIVSSISSINLFNFLVNDFSAVLYIEYTGCCLPEV